MIKNYLLSLANSVKDYYTGSAAFDGAIQRNKRLFRKFNDRIYTPSQLGGIPPEIDESIAKIKEANDRKTLMLKRILGERGDGSSIVELLGNLTENMEIIKILLTYLVELQKIVDDRQLDGIIHQLKSIETMLNNMLL